MWYTSAIGCIWGETMELDMPVVPFAAACVRSEMLDISRYIKSLDWFLPLVILILLH